MKIGLVTLCDFFNYGNRLQDFATQKILNDLGHDVVSLAVHVSKSRAFLNRLTKMFPIEPSCKRMKKFRKFSKEKMNFRLIDHDSIKKLKARYGEGGIEPLDAVVIGSDQTWNPQYIANYNKSFGCFVNKERRISFSTSIGVSKLPEKCVERFKVGLSEMKSISVRETAGSKIVESLTGKSCPVLIDPSLVLSKEQWNSFIKNIDIAPKEKYIFCYFFNTSYRKEAKKLAKKYNLKIVDINKYGNKYFCADPLEFVKLIQNASLVCTDSFHAHAFSICLEKPFISYPGVQSKNSRIETILKLTNLEERNYKTIQGKDIFNIDYSKIKPILDNEREKAIKYLTTALNEIKGE